jgi:hypothetical protein
VKLKVTFTADIQVDGGTISRDDLVNAMLEWLDDQDDPFTDSLVDYIPEEIEFDHLQLQIVSPISVH